MSATDAIRRMLRRLFSTQAWTWLFADDAMGESSEQVGDIFHGNCAAFSSAHAGHA